MAKTSVGGQAVMEGVMMRAPDGIALAVRKSDGTIKKEFTPYKSAAKKGSILGLPVIRGVVSFIESLKLGMDTTTRSAQLAGLEVDEEESRFEKWLVKVFGKSAEKVIMGVTIVFALILSVGLFVLLPTFLSDLIFKLAPNAATVWKSLTAGAIRLLIFIGYMLICSRMKEIKRVFMYHGAEHKTIACYEADDELTPENARKHSRFHPRCGTSYLFLVMMISILFFAVVGWSDNKLILFGTRILLIPVVAGISYEVLKLAASHDNIVTRIIRAPGLAMQRITTKEPTDDMLEVAITAFNMAMAHFEDGRCRAIVDIKPQETAARDEGEAEGRNAQTGEEPDMPEESEASIEAHDAES